MKIMIVDDEPLILSGIENIINNELNEYMEIAKAFDGIDALDKLECFIPDLIITDICMPEMSGLELIEKVIESGICSRFIILTGYADFGYARQALQYKALDYILKPIDKVKLVEILSSISKNFEQEQEKLIKQEVNKIREIMLYDVKYEESFLNKSILSMIYPSLLYMVIIIQIEDNCSEFDTTIFDTVLTYFFNKYHFFSLQNKNQIVILCNFDKIISERELNKQFSCLKIKNNINIRSIGISGISGRIDSVHALYNEALRQMYFYKYSSHIMTYEENDIKKVISKIDYRDIAKILEANSKEDMDALLNVYLARLLSIKCKDKLHLDKLHSIVISDVSIYLQNLGLTLDTIFGVNTDYDDDIINIIDDEQLKNSVQKILSEISNYLSEKEAKNRYSESVSKMVYYINNNYMKDISLDDIAETVNLHPNYASSLFKKEIGTSFIQYLNSYKIKKAKAFIKSNAELSLDKVAEMVGYENSGRFIKVFKKYCNITPGEYRNKVNFYINN